MCPYFSTVQLVYSNGNITCSENTKHRTTFGGFSDEVFSFIQLVINLCCYFGIYEECSGMT